MNSFEEKKTAAMKAIERLQGDTSVGPKTTLDALEELAITLDFMIETLREEIAKQE